MEDKDNLQHSEDASSSQRPIAGSSRSSRCSTLEASENYQCSTLASSETSQDASTGSSGSYQGPSSGSSDNYRCSTLSSSGSYQGSTSISSWSYHGTDSASSGSYHRSASSSIANDDDYNDRDKNRLLNIFPEKVWPIIFEEMFGTDDIVQLLNASLYFREGLNDNRTVHLFSKVWNILGHKYDAGNDKVYDERQDNERKNKPGETSDNGGNSNFSAFNKMSYTSCRFCRRKRYIRSFSGILKLRLVCKSWTQVIDKFYQTPRKNWLDPRAAPAPPLYIYLPRWRDNRFSSFSDGAQIARDLLQHFTKSGYDDTYRSPLLGKSVLLRYQLVDIEVYERGENEYFREVIKMLERYGHHIKECAIKIYRDSRFSLLRSEYWTLWKLLCEMPNLKSLYLESGSQDETIIDVDRTDRKRIQFMDYVKCRPIPHLKSLKYICIKVSYSFFLNKLLRKNNHITKLQAVDRRGCFHHGAIAIPFPNLKSLWINVISAHDFLRLQEPQVNWPLTKLRIRFAKRVRLDWSELFSVLENKWGQSLVALDFELPEQYRGTIFATDQLRLRKLNKLTVISPRNAILDFILPLKETLVLLNVTVLPANIAVIGRRIPDLFAGEEQIALACDENPISSKIWQTFPKLKSIQLTDYLTDNFTNVGQWRVRFFHRCDQEGEIVNEAVRRGGRGRRRQQRQRRWLRCPCL